MKIFGQKAIARVAVLVATLVLAACSSPGRQAQTLPEVETGPVAKKNITIALLGATGMVGSFVLEQASRQQANSLTDFSLNSLSIEQQDSYRLLLTIPFGALIVVIMRNIIGIRTTGTFMPTVSQRRFHWSRM